jgi:hypothetical protein
MVKKMVWVAMSGGIKKPEDRVTSGMVNGGKGRLLGEAFTLGNRYTFFYIYFMLLK